ncbi:MAG TPA: hypothetical protein VK432_03090 [Stellaceae bacterium]|nr:hypothetical protein [Stellaceae bacterium]
MVGERFYRVVRRPASGWLGKRGDSASHPVNMPEMRLHPRRRIRSI